MDDTAAASITEKHSIAARLRPVLVSIRKRYRREERVTIGDLVTEMGSDGGPLTVYLLSLPFLFPVSLGPITWPASFLMGFLGARLLGKRGDKPLPAKYLNVLLPVRAFDVMRCLTLRLAKWGRAREKRREKRCGAREETRLLGDDRYARRVAGVLIIYGAFLLILPLPGIPLSNTFPALGLAFAAAGLLKRSNRLFAASIGMMLFSTVYFVLILYLGYEAITRLYQYIFP